jgi:hypothetical protein
MESFPNQLAPTTCLDQSIPGGKPMDLRDIHILFEAAQRDGRVGLARKLQPVDARPVVPGEIVVTIIADEGKETQSKPAAEGDMIVPL